MPRLFSDATTAIIAFATSDDYPTTVPGAVNTLQFDDDSNPNLMSDLLISTAPYTLDASLVLKKNGVVVTVNAPSSLSSLKTTLENGFTDQQIKDVIVALWNGTATATQQRRALAYIIYKLRKNNLI